MREAWVILQQGCFRDCLPVLKPVRLQAARATAPREVADEMRMQEKRAAQKMVREETALKTKIAKDKEQQMVTWTVRLLSRAPSK